MIFYEKGRYRCRVTDQALGKASTGTPQFLLKFIVLARIVGPDQLVDVEQKDRTAWFYITEKTVQRLADDLRNLGFRGDSFAQLDLENPQCHDFRDSEVDMYCNEDTDQQGHPRERWSAARVGGLDVQPLDRKQARELDNLFGKFLKWQSGVQQPVPERRTPAATPAATAARQNSMEITDDDVPF